MAPPDWSELPDAHLIPSCRKCELPGVRSLIRIEFPDVITGIKLAASAHLSDTCRCGVCWRNSDTPAGTNVRKIWGRDTTRTIATRLAAFIGLQEEGAGSATRSHVRPRKKHTRSVDGLKRNKLRLQTGLGRLQNSKLNNFVLGP